MRAPHAGAPQDQQTWRPPGKDVLERFFAWLDFTPGPRPGETLDLFGGGGPIRIGDQVEIVIDRKHGCEIVDRQPVVAADRRYFKIRDRRVFSQWRGFSLFSGRKSNARAMKVKP